MKTTTRRETKEQKANRITILAELTPARRQEVFCEVIEKRTHGGEISINAQIDSIAVFAPKLAGIAAGNCGPDVWHSCFSEAMSVADDLAAQDDVQRAIFMAKLFPNNQTA